MDLKMKKVMKIQRKFVKKYLFKEPYCNYLNGVGISTLRIILDYRSKSFLSVKLKEEETLDDLCFWASLKKDPPEDIEFPEYYKGVRIYYEKSGEIEAY